MGSNAGGAASGGAIYAIGIFGAFFWFWDQANGFWEHILAFIQALFWPAWMVYQAFEALAR
jgi:hypothetical protein